MMILANKKKRKKMQQCIHLKILPPDLWDFYPTRSHDVQALPALETIGSPTTSLAPMGGGRGLWVVISEYPIISARR